MPKQLDWCHAGAEVYAEAATCYSFPVIHPEGIYSVNPAYGKDPEFYRFVRSLQSYELFLGKRSTPLLSADSPLFRYLAGPSPEGDKTPPGVTAEAAGTTRMKGNECCAS